MIAAQQYYIEHGSSPTPEKLQSLLPSYIPDYALNRQNAVNFWHSTILSKIKTPYFTNDKVRAQKVKEDIVSYAKYKWPLLFSRFYEAYKFAGPSLSKNDVIIAVNGRVFMLWTIRNRSSWSCPSQKSQQCRVAGEFNSIGTYWGISRVSGGLTYCKTTFIHWLEIFVCFARTSSIIFYFTIQ